jgi:hypothetical protein
MVPAVPAVKVVRARMREVKYAASGRRLVGGGGTMKSWSNMRVDVSQMPLYGEKLLMA